ncbi:MAG TPA: FtsX-like permease family protein [Gaiellaceae bacterium]|nr:FtsX-like permease family protein [Gaiellaceae bacterium]
MIKVALRGLLGRKLRTALTALAIVLGVAMVSGTYILTDTINKGFTTIFTQSYKNTSAVITARSAISNSNSNAALTGGFPASVLTRVRALPDVGAAEGSVRDTAKIVGRNGKTVVTHGAPALAFSVDPRDQRFNALTLVTGAWPTGSDEVAIDSAVAKKQRYKVGDTIGVIARGPERHYRVSGIAKFGSVSSIGSATMAIFDLQTAQRLFNKEGKFDTIRVASKNGVSDAKLAAEIAPVLPATAQVRTTSAEVKQETKNVSFIGFIQKFLLAFGGVALFVGAFVIFNTLSITVAQRMREFATLRTIGASRRQVLLSVLIEGLITAVIAAALGLFVGFGLAVGLDRLLSSIGISLPKSATVFATRTVVVSLVLGIVITLLASLRPALRATRVPPIAAVREGATLPRGRFAFLGPPLKAIIAAVGVALLLYGFFVHHISTAQHLVAMGAGALLLFVGVALISAWVVRPLAAVLGWPATKIGGSAGRLARSNAIRNPGRTASTAAALMIGIALVTFVAILAAGIRATVHNTLKESFVGDYAVTSPDGFTPFAPASERALAHVPSVTAVSGERAGDGRAFGKDVQVSGVNSKVAKVIHINWVEGSNSTPAALGSSGAILEKDYAAHRHVKVGQSFTLQTPTGKRLSLVLRGIYKAPKGPPAFGTVIISQQAFDAVYPQPTNIFEFVNIRGGANPANTATLKHALAPFPDVKLQTESQFRKNQSKFIDQLLMLLYVLLALSIIISLFGIVNTLVLTVFERTREIGMLRAVGMTRRQTRRMIRHESVITALIGTTLGLALGFFLAFLVTQALKKDGIGFAVPTASIIVFVIAAIIAGLLAAILPARRAARLNVLEALQYE